MKPWHIAVVILVIIICVVALCAVLWIDNHNQEPQTTSTVVPTPDVHARVQPIVGDPLAAWRMSGSTVVDHHWFILGWDNDQRVTRWASYRVAAQVAERGSSPKRPSRFTDDALVEGEPSHDDYTNSGLDRGHLAPSYAMWSRHGAEAMRKTFIMSNVVPQYPGLNRHVWQNLEERIAGRPDAPSTPRDEFDAGYAGASGGATVLVIPIWGNTEKIHGLRVPTAMACIVATATAMTGFLIPNQNDGLSERPADYATDPAVIMRQVGGDLPGVTTRAPDMPVLQAEVVLPWLRDR